MQVNWQFNANQYEPKQGIEGHPPALKIPFTITNTEIKPTKDSTPENQSGYLAVEFTSPIGSIIQRYNIKNNTPKAVEMAYQQLSALCRAVNIYQIDGNNECAALCGGKGLMDVGYQKDEEPNSQFPDRKGYTELKRVYDLAGNDPSKPGQAQRGQQQGGTAPMTQQSGGGWGQTAANPNPAQNQPQGQQNPNPGQAWQPGNAGTNSNPPWGSR
jgi:hypothetical protein